MKSRSKSCRWSLRNERGFTLLEVIIALAVTAGSVLLFSLALTQIGHARDKVNDDRQIEWHLFLNQLEYDLRDKTFIDSQPNRFRMQGHNETTGALETYTYSFYKDLIRRSVNGMGHQPMLMRARSFTVDQSGEQLKLNVVFDNEEAYTARLKVRPKSDD